MSDARGIALAYNDVTGFNGLTRMRKADNTVADPATLITKLLFPEMVVSAVPYWTNCLEMVIPSPSSKGIYLKRIQPAALHS